MATSMISERGHRTVYLRGLDGRFARRITTRLRPGLALIVALLLSLGLWGVAWLVVSSLVSAWPW
jgi:hypothetical protein